eukprot:augustus_masked-scaffold_37-processed-gene-0.26-mRNA-1 protein AED:0.01 eAED:0.01 QI:0/-1/0/1/-1/1/1/0/611
MNFLETTKETINGVKADLDLAPKLLSFKKKLTAYRTKGYTTTDIWYDTLNKHPQKPCYLFEDQVVTFQQVEDESNKMANWLIGKGLKTGDTCALFCTNKPSFVTSWLAMTKIGVKAALINTSIKQKGLLHCIKVSECKMVFFGAELADSVQAIQDEISELNIHMYADGPTSFAPNASEEIVNISSAPVSSVHRKGLDLMSTFGYIYTSGTTGLPKAAIILHQKMLSFGMIFAHAFGVKEDDIVYTCLPLFHSAGGGLGIGIGLYTGCTVAIARKFSARSFFEDCKKYKATVVQYIGELCRYLLLSPESSADNSHSVRIAIGNGLRPEVWNEFQTRFNIPEIGEFYGATEGNMALFNHCRAPQHQGYCGRFGPIIRKVLGLKLAKFDVVNEEPIRGKDGFVLEADVGEPGELLFIIKPNDPSTTFAGYSNKKATEKKIIRDAFVKGDQYFRTGDLLSRDVAGNFKFVDRIGDTFRWKGENCSTTEVTEVMGTYPGIEEVNVYGVQIPNNMDGRAPTAGITPTGGDLSKVDLDGLVGFLQENLPSYAVPLFLRILPQMVVTATMKHQKVKLRTEGIDVEKVTDPLYWLNPQTKKYEPFGAEEFAALTQMKAKL